MFNLPSYAVVAFAALSSVSGLVVPRATAPAGWATDILEPYTTYNTRYLALGCQNKHSSPFFDQCCHPLLAVEKLETARPPQCNPSASPSSPAANPTSTPAPSDEDDDFEDCDDEDDSDDTPVPVPSPSPSPEKPSPSPSTPSPTKAPTPTPTPVKPSPAPAPKPDNDPAPVSGVNSGGFATFFYQNGVAGACGTVHGENDMIAAIDGHRYGNLGAKSSLCGKKVKITNPSNKKSVVVTIADACPTCKNGNSIDLSVGAFKQIATLDQGMVGITWSFV